MTRLVSFCQVESFIFGDGEITRLAGEHALLTSQVPHEVQSQTASRGESRVVQKQSRSPKRENKSVSLFKGDFGVYFKREPETLRKLGHNLSLTSKTPSTDNRFVLAASLVWSADEFFVGLD